MNKKRFVWDLDGTLFKDTGKDYDKAAILTPLYFLLDQMILNDNIENIVITGRTSLPKVRFRIDDKKPFEIDHYFNKIICRNWEPADWSKYYPQYFQWKVEQIMEQEPWLVFEDDQQITRYLTKMHIDVIWTPMYAHMGE